MFIEARKLMLWLWLYNIYARTEKEWWNFGQNAVDLIQKNENLQTKEEWF